MLDDELTQKIKLLTQWDQLLYTAAEHRCVKAKLSNLDSLHLISLISSPRLQNRLQSMGTALTSQLLEPLRDLSLQFAAACAEFALHPSCTWWRLQQMEMRAITSASSRRAPALDINGQPCFTYMQRAAELLGFAMRHGQRSPSTLAGTTAPASE